MVFGFGKSKSTADSEQKTVEKAAPEGTKPGLFARLKQGLSKTRGNLGRGIGSLLGGGRIDEDFLEELETLLLTADVGVEASTRLIDALREGAKQQTLDTPEKINAFLQQKMVGLLSPCDRPLVLEERRPFVILMVGINGAGKTTTIGKLARQFRDQGKSVMLAAGDTFRAAAVEQLQEWGRRNDVPVVAQHSGADAASVIFDALQSAQAKGVDILIADTAGRLHTQSNLMEELKKVKRVMGKLDAEAPHEVMLVLDAGTGQNAINQAQQFHEAVGVTGITLTKLDGTAKGGVLFAIAEAMGLPVRFIGVGEKAEDLRVFAAEDFVRALLEPDS